MKKVIITSGIPSVEEITSKTWDDVKTFDDCLLGGDIAVIEKLKEQIQRNKVCPYLKLEGNYFYFCTKYLTEKDLKDNALGPENKKYAAHVGTAEMQLFCIDNHKNCNFYKGTLKR